MGKRIKKYIINLSFVVVLIAITLSLLFKDQEIEDIIIYIKKANPVLLLIGFLLLLIFIFCEGLVIYYLMYKFKHKIHILASIKYSFIGFFVSAITPSATGGQPAQLYYMQADGLSASISTLVLMIITITYKSALIIMGIVMLFVEFDFVIQRIGIIAILMISSLLINIFMISFMFLLIFKPGIAKNIVCRSVLWLGRKRILKNYKKLLKKLINGMKKYKKNANYLKNNLFILIIPLIITIFQRVALFAITYAIYKAFNLEGYTFFKIITLQTMIALTVDNIPLPGGIGASEGVFLIFFKEIFTSSFLTAGLLLTRSLNYYMIIIIGVFVMFYSHYKVNKKRELKNASDL